MPIRDCFVGDPGTREARRCNWTPKKKLETVRQPNAGTERKTPVRLENARVNEMDGEDATRIPAPLLRLHAAEILAACGACARLQLMRISCVE